MIKQADAPWPPIVPADIALIFLDSNKQPVDKWRYLQAFPTNITPLSLDTGIVDTVPNTFTVSFAFAEETWDE